MLLASPSPCSQDRHCQGRLQAGGCFKYKPLCLGWRTKAAARRAELGLQPLVLLTKGGRKVTEGYQHSSSVNRQGSTTASPALLLILLSDTQKPV